MRYHGSASELFPLMLEALAQSLIRGDAEAVSRLTRQAIDAGLSPALVLNDGLLAGMAVIGQRFRENEIFLPQVLVAARAMKAGIAHLEPFLAAAGVKPVGKVLVGTVQGDIHDIGKNLVSIMLRGAGFQVIDLGINVRAQQFIAGIEAHQPDIVGMSALLTTTMLHMRTNIAQFGAAGLRDQIKVIVGGAAVTPRFAADIGADAYGRSAADAVDKALALLAPPPA